MTPITIQGKTLLEVQTLDNFGCSDCQAPECVRVDQETKALYFESGDKFGGPDSLYCISEAIDMVFINNTPEDIARYVAARLEQA